MESQVTVAQLAAEANAICYGLTSDGLPQTLKFRNILQGVRDLMSDLQTSSNIVLCLIQQQILKLHCNTIDQMAKEAHSRPLEAVPSRNEFNSSGVLQGSSIKKPSAPDLPLCATPFQNAKIPTQICALVGRILLQV